MDIVRKHLQAVTKALTGKEIASIGELLDKIEQLTTLRTQLTAAEGLKEFARHVIKQECWAIFDLDGGDIQDLAEKLGLIEPHIATEEDIDEEDWYEVGDTIFRFSKILAEQAKDKP